MKLLLLQLLNLFLISNLLLLLLVLAVMLFSILSICYSNYIKDIAENFTELNMSRLLDENTTNASNNMVADSLVRCELDSYWRVLRWIIRLGVVRRSQRLL